MYANFVSCSFHPVYLSFPIAALVRPSPQIHTVPISEHTTHQRIWTSSSTRSTSQTLFSTITAKNYLEDPSPLSSRWNSLSSSNEG